MPNPDPNTELATILAYAQAAAAYVAAAGPLIAALEAASNNNPARMDSDSPDVEKSIQAILTFAAASPIPTPPAAVTSAPAAAAPTSTPTA